MAEGKTSNAKPRVIVSNISRKDYRSALKSIFDYLDGIRSIVKSSNGNIYRQIRTGRLSLLTTSLLPSISF